MAVELTFVRTKFVDKVTKTVIKQLLDDILEDGIINDGEKESIVEENPIRADQARALIDTVKKKGDNASWKLIAHIKRRDGTLYSEVGLSSGQPAPSAAPALAAEPQMKKQESAAVTSTTNTFAKDEAANKDNDEEIYPVTEYSISNRVALLITNIKFDNEQVKNRLGAEKDEKNMEKLLTDLRYEVVKHTNLTGKAIDDAVIDFSKHPKLKETDSVLVVIMSHGKLGTVLGVKTSGDDDEFPIDNIYKHLGSENCPALLDKPKIIIIQACRGGKPGSVIVCDDANSAVLCDDVKQPSPPLPADDDIEEDYLRTHREKDFISLLSSTPGTVSYRHQVYGSFLIQYIAETFEESARKNDIEVLFRKVMKSVKDSAQGTVMQMPTKDRCTLTKPFYFFPGP
uniref:Caspase 1 n=1 Tax=Totoaba macdonaldi TaxID=245095 RepID=A0A1W6JGU8_9TELE|nr:caspase 1 [Totoaba macdonaldi]